MKHPVDNHVGQRIRQARWMRGITQNDLANCIGTTLQQVQKYETSTNRVSASKLWAIAQALNVEIEWFYEGIDSTAGNESGVSVTQDYMQDKEAILLVKAYYSIPQVRRKSLFQLAKGLAALD